MNKTDLEQMPNKNDFKAIIMAGGEGKRLRPLTCTMPKPLVPLLGKPVINYCLELLKKHGISDVTTTLFYMGKMIEDRIKEGSDFEISATHSYTDTPLGTAGSVKSAVGNTDKTILVISGDTLTDCDLSAAIDFHKNKKAKATIVLKKVKTPTEYGVALIDSENRITRFLEKPGINEVFSDLANTGIYILDRDIIDKIPENKYFDFSMDLFPLLLSENLPLYAYETNAYWCDIGSIEQYIQAQCDMLDKKVSVRINATENAGVFIENGAKIADSASISAPCYICKDAEIGEQVKLNEYSVIGQGAKLFLGCSVKKSIIMENAIIRKNAQIRGAIIAENASVLANGSVFEGSVVGSGSTVCENSIITNGASVWPNKVITRELKITDNVIWGIGKKIISKDNGLSGYCDTDLSPETAVRISAAFASILKKGDNIAVSCDGKQSTVMQKYAMLSGAISQGIDVFNLPSMPFCQFGFSIKNLGLQGGIYIEAPDYDSHIVSITLCDKNGVAIDTTKRRKLMQEYSWGEQLPKTDRQIGIVTAMENTVRSYSAELQRNINVSKLKEGRKSVCVDIPEGISEIISPILLSLGCRVYSVYSGGGEALYSEVRNKSADIGIYMENGSGKMPRIITASGSSLYDMGLLCVLTFNASKNEKISRVAMPVSFPDEYSRFLMDNGIGVISVPDEWHIFRRSAMSEGTYIPELFDPALAILKTVEICSVGKLDDYIRQLPEVYIESNTVPCTYEAFGRVFRALSEIGSGMKTETIDGVKLHSDNGWILVRADDGVTGCKIICGSYREEYAKDLTSMYVDKLKEIIGKDNEK